MTIIANQPNPKYITLKFDEAGWEVFKDACTLMRLKLGNFMIDGLPIEASYSQCVLLICAEFLSQPLEDDST